MNLLVKRLVESQINEAAHVLGRAFFDDPLEKYVLPEDISRVQLSTQRFQNVIRYGHLFGDVFVTSTEGSAEISSVAMWLRPNDWEMTDERMGQAGMFALPCAPYPRLAAQAQDHCPVCPIQERCPGPGL